MIKRQSEMKQVLNEHMRGGDGTVQIIRQLEPGEFNGKSRLPARFYPARLRPGTAGPGKQDRRIP